MCILAHEGHLSDTKIFTCVSKIEGQQPLRQFTIYQNSVSVTNTEVKENFMCLPIPLQTGLIPSEHILLYDFNAEGKKEDLAPHYEQFFTILDSLFVPQRKNSDNHLDFLDNDDDDENGGKEILKVVKVGNYLCSLAASPSDVLRLDEAVFGKPVGLQQVLETNYANNFAFLICNFSQESKKDFIAHPIAYSHPIASDGRLFIPTKHYHGGVPNEKFVDDWSHQIFIFNGSKNDISNLISKSKYKNRNTETIVKKNMVNSSRETDIRKVLLDTFEQHNHKDVLPIITASCGSMISILGRFDNIDVQVTSVVALQEKEKDKEKDKDTVMEDVDFNTNNERKGDENKTCIIGSRAIINTQVHTCCQFAPIFTKRALNFEKAKKILGDSGHSNFDLLLFPEMAFVGYMFDNKKEIEPYMEEEKGPTFEFCKEVATKYKSFVAAGYPRIQKRPSEESLFYNSMCFVSPSGELLATYDKSFLYETDHNWAAEGSGFVTLDIPEWNKKVGLGICMDINPYEYKDSSLYEFANYHKTAKTDLIIFLANWLDSDTTENDNAFSTHSYWANRLRPLIKSDCTFVACNRTGKEKSATFCGGSCVISLKKPSLDAALLKRDEHLLVHNI